MPLWKYNREDLQTAAVRAFGKGSIAQPLITGLCVRVQRPDGLSEVTLNGEQVANYLNEYDTIELQEKFNVHGFLAPYVEVTRKSDGQRGYMEFQAFPRKYYNFKAI